MFTGREKELAILEKAYAANTFQMVVMYGRRRVGKTSILQKFAEDKADVIFFTGRETNAQENLAAFSRSIANPGLGFPDGNIASPVFPSFETALAHVFAKKPLSGKTVLIIDEYPYLAQSEPGISSLLQSLIDHAKGNTDLMLVLCGSSMSFMEHQVLGHQSPLYGRRTAQIKVEPFDVFDTARFLKTDSLEKALPYYGIVGGIPLYLEQFDMTESLEDNLASMLEKGSFLSVEPENYLMQEVRSPALYNAIISAVASGETKASAIANAVGVSAPSATQYLKSLGELGIIEKSMPVLMANKKQGVYRVADSLFRFWYKFIPKYAAALELGLSKETARAIVEESMSTFLGPVFEEACRQWLMREIGKRNLAILPTGVGSWWGNDPSRKQQAEIDVVITGSRGELILGECKWREKETDADVVDTLVHRSGLLPGSDKKLYFFSKAPFTEACRESAERHRVTLVRACEMLED